MSGWLHGVDPADVIRVELLRVTIEGRPSCVTSATLRLHLRDGRVGEATVGLGAGVAYETLRAEIAAANRALRD